MRLKKIQLHPFAGISNHTLSLKDGLNVIVGPNEAGKSTLVSALRLSLLMPTKVSKTVFKREIERYMPLSGGDTVQTQLEFEVDGEPYVLEKAWGGSQISKLTLPGGELFSDAERVQGKLQELLDASPATWEKVMFAFQSRLADTIDELTADRAPNEDLSDLLRKAVFETDGVRVEDLGTAIHQIEEEYFGRWDRRLSRPEGNRGIENRWKRGVGTILYAFYVMKELDNRLQEVRSHLHEMDLRTTELRKLNAKLTKLDNYVEKNRSLVKAARERGLLEARIREIDADLRAMRKAVREWPKTNDELATLAKKKKEVGPHIKLLTNQKKAAQEYEKQREKVQILKKAKAKRKVFDQATNDHAKLKVVTEGDIETLMDLQSQIAVVEAKLSAGKVSIDLHAKKALTIKLSKGQATGRNRKLAGGKHLKETVEGQVQLEHTDWDLLVRSGEVAYAELEEQIDDLKLQLKDELQRIKCPSVKIARNSQAKYSESARTLEDAQQAFESSLEGEDFESLKSSLEGKAVKKPDRSLEEIIEELAEERVRTEQIDKDISQLRSRVDEWEEEYGSPEEAADLENDLKEKRKDLKAQLGELPPLPARVKDPQKFIESFEEKKNDLDLKKEQRSDVREEIAELRGRAPEESEEEIASYLGEATTKFDRVLEEGRAVEYIRQQFDILVDEMDSSTMDPWTDSLREVLEPLTAGRYEATSDLNEKSFAAGRIDGLDVPANMLSQGTKVGIGLAIRLAMASYFLEGGAGFLILDDPLVDLDPNRQTAASEVIREFAKHSQVVVLTCQPTHADILGGDRIELEAVAS